MEGATRFVQEQVLPQLKQMDGLVYELYGLTEHKIAIVEARNEAQNIEEVNARAE
jgi:hypothetical protein